MALYEKCGCTAMAWSGLSEDNRGPLEELDADLWILTHPDARPLQRVKFFFNFMKENVRLPK